jgi:FkbM family methyltransferase
VGQLGLQSTITPICGAVSDRGGGVCSIAFNSRESLFAQVRPDKSNPRAGAFLTWCPEVTIDCVLAALGARPSLVKIDVEGREAHVLRGARGLLRGSDRPVVVFELNPATLSEVGSDARAIVNELVEYSCFYLDDFEGQRVPRGQQVADLSAVSWVCNLVAVPNSMPETEMRVLFNRVGDRD